MANEHRKGYWTSLAIKEMQMKTTTRCPFTPTRMVIIKEADSNRCGAGFWRNGHLYTLLGGMSNGHNLGEQFVSSSIVKHRVNHVTEPFHV